MTAHCEGGKLDLARGIILAHAAYEKRAGRPPPHITAAKFVEPGYTDKILKEYTGEELAAKRTVAQSK
jgi:hypothetical protein